MSKSFSTSSLHLDEDSLHRPFKLFRPTHIAFQGSNHEDGSPVTQTQWHSREHRKGHFPKHEYNVHHEAAMEKGESLHLRLEHLERTMKLKPKLWADISVWVAIAFTLGSVAWVVNAFFVFLPELPAWSAHLESWKTVAAALAFVGGTLFEIGGYLMLVEAWNRGQESGWVDDLEARWRRELDSEKGSHDSRTSEQQKPEKKPWIWWGPPNWRDIGFTAAFIQFMAASIFWVSTLTGLPGVIPKSDSVAITDIFFWTPQVIGGTGFIISSLLLMLETQTAWYKPNFQSLGYHIGFWNLVGGTGFMLCGALGYSMDTRAVYQSGLSTFWGSWAFLIGSILQTWEAVVQEGPEE
ncbi:hypothetical protein BD410DRAFT_726472 [Rickenella mellea]|uniref:Integral membrane protein n=1 Tax=Rickenella mellea TaxID=50990 RepID=A0A4Y7PX49_9AGAM|nr:hypothetical protein BD410DRAFT_726472 [Rickenella mellea]